MKRIWMLAAILAFSMACASNQAKTDNPPAETSAPSQKGSEAVTASSDWQLRYRSTTMLTQERYDCVFAKVDGGRVGYGCSTPGTEMRKFLPLSEPASEEILSAFESVDWNSEMAKKPEPTVGPAPTHFILEQAGGAIELTRLGMMSKELRRLEAALLSTVRADQDERRSVRFTEGVCAGACEPNEWCKERVCVTPEGGYELPNDDECIEGKVRTDSLCTKGCCDDDDFPADTPCDADEPICHAPLDVGDPCARHEQCGEMKCVGILPVCAEMD